MQDREVQVTITLKASQVETVREWFARAFQFPDVMSGYATAIAKLLSKDEMSPEDGEELARLLQGMNSDNMQASLLRNALRGVLDTAVISDPDGRKGWLQ